MAVVEEEGGADSPRPLSLSSTQKHGTCGAHTHTQIACAPLPNVVRLMCTRPSAGTQRLSVAVSQSHADVRQNRPTETDGRTVEMPHHPPCPPCLTGSDKQNCADRYGSGGNKQTNPVYTSDH